MSAGGLDVGRVYASLGARLDDDGFDKFDRRVEAARKDARRPIVADARVDANLRDADQYDRRVDELRRDARDDIVAHARVDADTRGIDRYSQRLDNVDGQHDSLVRGSGRVRGALGVLAVGGAGFAAAGLAAGVLAKGVHSAVTAFEDSEKVARRQALVIRTMGQDAGATAEHVDKLAGSMMRKTGVDDDAIIAGANVLRTFKNIRNEAGAGNDVFDRSTRAALDLSAALGTDLQSASIQLGKALNEPAKGAAALSRSGTVAKSDVEELKAMAEAGAPVLEQQRFLLDAVEKQVKGTAEETATGSAKMAAAWGELQEKVGEKLAPAFNRAAGAVTDLLDRTGKGKGPLVAVGRVLGTVADAVGDVVGALFDGGRAVVDFLRHNDDARAILRQVGKTLGVFADAAKDVGQAVGKAFRDMAPDLRRIATVALEVWRRFEDAAQPIIRAVIPAIVGAIKGLLRVVSGVVKVIAGILTGDWARAWEGLGDVVGGAVDAVVALAEGGFGVLKKVVGGVIDFLLGGVTTVLDVIADVVGAGSHLPVVGGKFGDLADKLDGAKDSIDGYRRSLRETNKEHRDARSDVDRYTDRVQAARKAYREARAEQRKLKEGTDEYREAARRTAARADDLRDAIKGQRKASRDAVRPLAILAANAFNLGDVVADVADSVGGNVNEVLKELGAKALRYTIKKPKKTGAGVGEALDAAGAILGLATGGIPNRGASRQDDHLVIGPDGRPVAAISGSEGILNDPQMGIVDHALAVAQAVGALPYGGLDELWGAGFMHNTGGRLTTVPSYAAGGSIVPVPGFPGEYAASSILDEIATTRRRSGLTLTDAYGQGHKSPGHTVTGTAADWSGADGAMDAEVRRLVAEGYLVGYDGRFGSQDWPGHGPSTRTPNYHLHVEYGGKGKISGAAAAGVELLKRLRIEGPAGALRNVAQGAADTMRKGANAFIRRKAAVTPVAGGGAQAADANVVRAFRQASSATGANPLERLGLFEAGIVESGLRNLEYGDADSLGALQERVSIYGRAHALNPLASAVRFLTDAKALRPWPGTAGHLAQAVQRSAYPDRYDAVAGQARRYLAGGGRLPHFKGGGALGRTRRLTRRAANSQRRHEGRAQGSVDLLANRGIARSLARGERGFPTFELEIQDLEGDYTRADRAYGFSDEEFLIEQDDGTTLVDQDAVNRRLEELRGLFTIRQKIRRKIEAYRDAVKKAITGYRKAIRTVKAAMKAAGDAILPKDRTAYKELLGGYRQRIGDLKAVAHDLGIDLQDNALDGEELLREYAEVSGTTAPSLGEAPGPSSPEPSIEEQSDLANAQAIATQATERATALQADLTAAQANLTAFGGAGDIGAGGVTAFAAGTARGLGYASGYVPAAPGATVTPGVGGGGLDGAGVNVVVEVRSFLPPTGAQAQELGDAVVAALASRPAPQVSTRKVG